LVRRSRSLLIGLWLVAFAVVVAVGIAAAVITSSILLPGCASCHMVDDFAKATEASSHATVPCAQCHVSNDAFSRTSYGVHVVRHTLVPGQDSVGRSASTVPNDACLTCHSDGIEGIAEVNGLRIEHSKCAAGSQCTDCHSATAHGTQVSWVRTYTMDGCLHCHGQEDEVVKCDTCHSERSARDRLVVGPWRVTHGKNWRHTHGMGDQLTCSACHPKGYCAKCHGPGLPHGPGFLAEHSAVALSPGQKCLTCHTKTFCTDCHGIQMPHPKGFPTHSSLVKKNGDKVCRSCHSQKDCTQCHELHVHPGGAVNPGVRPPTPGGN